jgi:hypothetical protein
VGAAQVGPLELGAAEQRLLQVGPGQLGVLEAGPANVGAAQVGPGQPGQPSRAPPSSDPLRSSGGSPSSTVRRASTVTAAFTSGWRICRLASGPAGPIGGRCEVVRT